MKSNLTIVLLLLCIVSALRSQAQTNQVVCYFNKAQFTLTPDQTDNIDQLIDSFTLSRCSFTVSGYTDREGNKKRNLELSLQRANAVVEYLIFKGVDSLKIKILKGGILGDTAETTEEKKKLNRKAVLRITCNQAITDTEKNKPVKFENDTVIYGKQGTQVLVKAGSFYPRKIKDVTIKINEIFSMCDSIPDDVETVTETGICLASGGMVFIQAEYKKKSIRTGRNALFEVRIPVLNNDTSFNFYVAVRQRNGKLRWREQKKTIMTVGGKTYFVFETNVLGGFNCDVPIPGCDMNSDYRYVLKTWTLESNVRFFIEGEFAFFTARELSRRKFSIPANVPPEKILVMVTGYKSTHTPWPLSIEVDFITKRLYRLSEFKYKKRKNFYKLKFKHLEVYRRAAVRNAKIKNGLKCPQ